MDESLKKIQTEIYTADNRRLLVSTVELPSSMWFHHSLKFETMVFGMREGGSIDYSDLDACRYENWDAAVQGHWDTVERWKAMGEG